MIEYVGNDRDFQSREIRNCSFEAAMHMLEDMRIIGVDFETEGFCPHTKRPLSLQLGNYEDQVFIDWSTLNESQLGRLRVLLERKDKWFLFQNAKFDLRFLYKYNIYPRRVYDTMLAEEVLYHGINNFWKSLKYLVEHYCNEELDKTVRGKIHKEGLSEAVIYYGARDVKFLETIMNKQMTLAEHAGVIDHIHLENDFVRVLAYTEYCGIYLNKDLWEKKIAKAMIMKQRAIKALDKCLVKNKVKGIKWSKSLFEDYPIVDINWASNAQVKKLFKSMGFDLTYMDKGEKKEGVGSEVIDKIKDQHPILRLFSIYQEWGKELSTYGHSFYKHINKVTGRVHSNFTQILSTGRLSSDNPNLQNIPKAHGNRECFTNQYEHTTLIDADYSAQEDKVFVNFSKEKNLIDFYLNMPNADGHSYVAKLCFPKELGHMTLKEIKQNRPDLRQNSKSAKFAIHYGGDGYTVSRNLNLPLDEGKFIVESYFKAFPDIKNYFDECEKLAFERGYILIDPVTGFKEFLPDVDDTFRERLKKTNNPAFWKQYSRLKHSNPVKFAKIKEDVSKFSKLKSEIRKKALNYPIQGSAASLTKRAGVLFFDWMLDNNMQDIVLIPNFVHDEIMLECPKDMAESVADTLKNFMKEAADPYCKIVPLEAVPVITPYWTH